MDDTTLLARMAASMRLVGRLMADNCESTRLLELEDGAVQAIITPATPGRSIHNSVDYHRTDALEAALPQLSEEYERAGIAAWTVWAPAADDDAIELLESRGHVLDAAPRAMGAPIADCDLGEGAAAIDWTHDADAPLIGVLNARAYGYPEASFAAAFGSFDERMHIYVARLDGEPVSCVLCSDCEGDCGIWWVATLPEARGHGLSGKLLRQALIDALERGCDSTTLQGTSAGYPIYAKVGYRDLGELQMWERRRERP